MIRSAMAPIKWMALLIPMVLLAAALPLAAQEKAPEEWQFQVDPFMWGTGFTSTLKFPQGALTSSVDFGKVMDNLQSAFMLHFEAKNGRWGITADPIYASLGKAGQAPNGIHVDGDVELYVMGVGGFYRAYQGERVDLDILFGGRYNHTAMALRYVEPNIKNHASVNWWDPFVGVRVEAKLSERIDFGLRADIAGHGGGADPGYCLAARFDFRMTRATSLSLGYIHYRANDPIGGSKSGLEEFDLTLSGPYAGLAFRF